MAKYKILKSVAHNTGHSLLGATNWYDGQFPFQHLSQAMRRAGVGRVELDLLDARLEPSTVHGPQVDQFAELGKIILGDLLAGEGWSSDRVRRATFFLDLDARACRVELEDDRGKVHLGNVVDWGFQPPAA
jgi:hypothetical protein